MNAPVMMRPGHARPIDWRLEQSQPGKPKPLGEEESPIPITEPEPPKPDTQTRNACDPMTVGGMPMAATAFWQMTSLSGTIWLSLAMSAMSFPYEAAMVSLVRRPGGA